MAQGTLPWSVGTSVQGVGTLEQVQRHPEYVRTRWRSGDLTHRIEIVPRLDEDDPWSAGPYRVQPAPGAKADNAVLSAMRRHLITLSSEPDHAPFVGLAREPTSPEDALELPTSRGDKPYPPAGAPWLLVVLFAGLALALIAWIRSLDSGAPERTLATRGSIAVLLTGLGVGLTLDPQTLDPGWITLLHEGNTEHVIRALWGSGHHGPLWDAARWGLSSVGGYEELLPIRVIVTLNLLLAAMNVVAIILAARLVTGRWWAALLVGLTVSTSPLFINSALSELSSQLILTIGLAMGAAIASLGRERAWATIALVLLTASLGLVRAEWALAGGLITLAALAVPWFEGRTVEPRWLAPALAVVLGIAAWWGAPMILEGERATYLGQGLNPTDWGPLVAPLVYAMGMGLGLVGLMIIGAGRLLTLGRWVGVPLALVVLTRMYTEASHRGQAPYETLRYAQLMLPLVVACGLVGWRVLLAEVTWTGTRRSALIGAVVVLHLAPLGEPLARAVFPHHHLASSPLYGAPLDRDQQREARALIALIEETSDCAAVAVSARDPKPTDPIEGWDYVFFGGPIAGPLTAERDPERLSTHLKNLGSARCARFFSGLDCHVETYEGCEQERSMGTSEEVERADSRPYYDHLVRRNEAPLQVTRWGETSAP